MYNKYPYTDFHELNLDWILSEMKRLNQSLDDVLQEAITQATANAKEYIDSQIGQLESDFRTLQDNFNDLNSNVSELTSLVNTFITNYNAELAALKLYIDDSLNAQTLQTQLLIKQNNDMLLAEMEQYLGQIKVINFFTGEKVTIQDMFNYLAGLHLNDSIDYDTMAYRALTYTYLAGLNINYTNLAMHGNTLYI